MVSSRGTDEGRFDEVLKDWARLRKLAKMGCVKGLRSVSDGKLLGMALLALVIDTAILLFLRSNEWKKKNRENVEFIFFRVDGRINRAILHARQGRLLLCRCHMSMRRRASSFLQRANFTR